MYSKEILMFVSKDVFMYIAILWVFCEYFIFKKSGGVHLLTLMSLTNAMLFEYPYYFTDGYDSFHWNTKIYVKSFFLLLAVIHAIALLPSPVKKRRYDGRISSLFMLSMAMSYFSLVGLQERFEHYGKKDRYPLYSIASHYFEAFAPTTMTLTIEKFNKYPFIPLMMVHYLVQAIYFYYFDWPDKNHEQPEIFYSLIVYNLITFCIGIFSCIAFYYLQRNSCNESESNCNDNVNICELEANVNVIDCKNKTSNRFVNNNKNLWKFFTKILHIVRVWPSIKQNETKRITCSQTEHSIP